MEKCYAILFKNFQHRKVKKRDGGQNSVHIRHVSARFCTITGPVHGKNYFTSSILCYG